MQILGDLGLAAEVLFPVVFAGIGATALLGVTAAWMVAAGALGGVLYLVGILVSHAFKRNALELWLKHSSFGLAAKDWSPLEEIRQLEFILFRPNVVIKSTPVYGVKPSARTGMQVTIVKTIWEITISLPHWLLGHQIGVNITTLRDKGIWKSEHVLESLAAGKWAEVKDDKQQLAYQLSLEVNHQGKPKDCRIEEVQIDLKVPMHSLMFPTEEIYGG